MHGQHVVATGHMGGPGHGRHHKARYHQLPEQLALFAQAVPATHGELQVIIHETHGPKAGHQD